jgi:precorrin-3B methylase|tara:strand:- start:200 stop:403 length:204 start_codon:yes stop_codon:yes gene_type:complete
MIPVEGHKNLFRDEKTNAIINTDTIGYENYMRMRKRNDDKQAEMDAMKKELETLKSMLNELASKITS